jgi:hypothetical protein
MGRQHRLVGDLPFSEEPIGGFQVPEGDHVLGQGGLRVVEHCRRHPHQALRTALIT